LVVNGDKTVEVRSRRTNFRGDVVIISTLKPAIETNLLNGYALGIVTIVDCIEFIPSMQNQAKIKYIPNHWAWVLKNPRLIDPVKTKGQLGIFNRDIQNLQLI